MSPHCNVCATPGPFLQPDLGREGQICRNCGASGRTRALLYALGRAVGFGDSPVCEWPRRPELTILDASGRSAYPALLRERFRYVNTEYRPDPAGREPPFGKYADLEHLSYSNGSLDVVLAGDVFEHVRDDVAAFHEVYRVLKPGGALIFTVPYDPALPETLVRVRVEGDRDVLMLPAEYHGGGGRSLAYRTYGPDLPERLRRAGFATGSWPLEVPRYAIHAQQVFLCHKAPALDLRFANPPPVRSEELGPAPLPLLPTRLWVLLKYNAAAARQVLTEIRSRL